MRVVLQHQLRHNFYRILMYASMLMTEQGIPHGRVVYQFLDKKNRVFRSSSVETIEQVLYVADPFAGEAYEFGVGDGSRLRMSFAPAGNDQRLYPYIDKESFEQVFRIVLETENGDTIDRFLKTAIDRTQRFFDETTANKNLHVYQYNEINEIWDKITELPYRAIDTIYLPNGQARAVLDDVVSFMDKDTRAAYHRFGIPYHKTYCFYGPPGSGKTSLIHAICSSIQRNVCIYRFSPTTKDSDFSASFRWMPKNSVFVLEDLDCIFRDRKETKGVLSFSGLLNTLDGFFSSECLITFMTTNLFHELDEAIKRPGRIDYLIEFSHISQDQVFQMLSSFFPKEKEHYKEFYRRIQNIKMTTTHLQKYLFSRYPRGGILDGLDDFLAGFHKYHLVKDNAMYL
ncbi:AAA family ATPase [bacterium]|nr:AAA family ATPase [bacterium]